MVGGRRFRRARRAQPVISGIAHGRYSGLPGKDGIARNHYEGGDWSNESGRTEAAGASGPVHGPARSRRIGRVRGTGLGLLLFVWAGAVVLVDVMRIGEAENPGPPRVATTFDQAEVEGFPEEYDADEWEGDWREVAADGVEAQEDEGLREYDVEVGAERACLPPEIYWHTASVCNEETEGQGFRWPVEMIEDMGCDELDDIVRGAHGSQRGPSGRDEVMGERARVFYQNHGMVVDEPRISSAERSTVGVELPFGLEDRLNEDDRKKSAARAVKWSAFFSNVVRARKEVEERRCRSRARRAADRGGGGKAVRSEDLPRIPIIQEQDGRGGYWRGPPAAGVSGGGTTSGPTEAA